MSYINLNMLPAKLQFQSVIKLSSKYGFNHQKPLYFSFKWPFLIFCPLVLKRLLWYCDWYMEMTFALTGCFVLCLIQKALQTETSQTSLWNHVGWIDSYM